MKPKLVKRKSTSVKRKNSLYDRIKKNPKKYALLAAAIPALLEFGIQYKKQKDNQKYIQAANRRNESKPGYINKDEGWYINPATGAKTFYNK